MQWDVFVTIRVTSFLGQVEADTEPEAVKAASDKFDARVSLCPSCTGTIQDSEVVHIQVQPARED